MKKCNKCGKVTSEYYKHPLTKDGFMGKCKSCSKLSSKENRTEKLDYYREYDRARGSRQDYSYFINYRKTNKEKYIAHNKVNNAIRDGKLFKPEKCSICKKKKRIIGHHEDYSKPLDVIWMCQGCHKQHHAKEQIC